MRISDWSSDVCSSDLPFEAYLLEVLSDFQITIPEIGAVKAEEPPIVIITSNRTREIHDALQRRCLYYWVDYPAAEGELAILNRKVPGAPQRMSRTEELRSGKEGCSTGKTWEAPI